MASGRNVVIGLYVWMQALAQLTRPQEWDQVAHTLLLRI